VASEIEVQNARSVWSAPYSCALVFESRKAELSPVPIFLPQLKSAGIRRTPNASRLRGLVGSIFLIVVAAHAEDKINYQQHILPLIEANCSKCHNGDKKKADLDLTSYQGALQGSGSGPVLISGNPDASKLWKAITHAEEPNMPPSRPRLAEKDLATFKQWIAGGLLENAGGKAVAAAKPALDLTLKPGKSARPEGPPPMPNELPFEPVQKGVRGNAILGITASPWAPLIAVAGHQQVLLFNSDTRGLLGVLPFSEGDPVDLTFSRNGKLLVASGGHGAQSGRVALWDIVTGKRLATLGQEYDTVLAADIRADQAQLALGGPSRLVKILTTSNGEVVHKLKKHTDWVTAVAFSPSGQMLATADRNGGIILWDPESGQELFTLSGHKSAVTALSWRDDSKLLASSSEDGTVKLWEMQEGKQAKSWNAHNSGALWVCYSHEGQLATCGRDGTVQVWDGNGNSVRKLEFSGELPLRAVFTEDGKRIFTTDFNGQIVAWNAADGKRVGELKAPEPVVTRAMR
jgi:DNA-binding beta-propeller fold protein YncE